MQRASEAVPGEESWSYFWHPLDKRMDLLNQKCLVRLLDRISLPKAHQILHFCDTEGPKKDCHLLSTWQGNTSIFTCEDPNTEIKLVF